MIQNIPLLTEPYEGLLNIAHLFAPLLEPRPPRTEWSKRMSLWIASNGRCSNCGAFLAANTLVPAKSTPTAQHPFVRVSAICPTCAKR